MTKLEIETINHVGLVVRDAEAAERFYVGVLGLRRHPARPSWLLLNDESALHLIHLPDAEPDASPHDALRHVALQVPDLRAVLGLLLDRGVRVFQVAFDGSVRHLVSPDDALDFGVGSLFVRDPDGNTIEFLELGRGLFASEGRDSDRAAEMVRSTPEVITATMPRDDV